MVKRLLSLLTVCLFVSSAAFAQTGTLTGTVTDQSSGETLPGVNIFIPELQRGAATNAQGEYTIEGIEYGTYTVRATFIGYTTFEQMVTIDEATETLNIALNSSLTQLDDVVVTAFGVEKQVKDLAYAAQKVDVEEVINSGSDNFMNALSGRVAGMQVQSASGMGGSTDIILRGANSFTGNNQALFVVDGVPYANNRFNTDNFEDGFAGYDYGNTGADINPESIASITVLKGPAAAALYGSRASNGAIIIETKKGTPGSDRVQVTFNTSVGVSMVDPSTFPTYQDEYGAGYAQSFYTIENIFTDAAGDSLRNNVVRYNGDGSLGPAFDPNKMVYQWDAFYPNSPTYGEPRPWVAAKNQPIEFFEMGTNLQNSLLINGGINDGGGYYSLGYTQGNIRGILPNSSLDKYKLSFSGGYDVSEKFTVSASVDYSRTEGIGRPKRGYSTIMSEMRQWWQTNVDVERQKAAYFRNRQNVTWNLNTDRTGPIYWNNPYWDRYENFASDERDRYVGYAEAQYDITDWLNLSGRVSVDSYNQLIEERLNVGSVGVPGYLRRTQTFNEYNYNLLANYSKQLTETIAIDGLVGMNIRRQYVKGIEAETNGGLVVPGLYSLSNSVNSILYPEETARKLGVNGFFASFNLNYEDFLAVSLTGRRDKASSLPQDNNVYYYPSASVGFTFSEFLETDWLSFGKVRASWASVGNTAPVFSLNDTYTRQANFGSAGLYTLPSVKNNPNLKPELTKTWEVGLQLGFLQDRVFIDATYYNENTVDQIMPVDISTATGFTSKYVNAGNLQNRGVELALTGRPVTTADFSWSVSVNWSKNISKVVSLADGIDYLPLSGPQGGISIGAEEGQPFGVIRGSDFIYHENGQPIVGDNGLYLQTSTSNHVIGNMNPDWRGGVSNQFNYKNWSLNFLVDVRWGGDIFSLDQWYGQGTGLYPITAGLNDKGNPKRDPVSEGGGVKLPGVNADGSPNDIYRSGTLTYGYGINPNAAYVYDGSYVKLREVGISYNLSQNLLSKIGVLRGASISVVGRNLWIIHKNLPHADPEQSIGSATLQGYQGGNLPSTRNVTFNLQLNF
ncbi:MAG TPA: SusC/RagA family TonB-linked outer membrane protein [Balneolaceae bacterium]